MKCTNAIRGYLTNAAAAHCVIASLVLTASATAPASAIAAETTDEPFANLELQDLMQLDVFRAASLLPTQHSKAPGTVYSFNREDFTRLGARRLDDLMQFVPGIQLNQNRKRHQSIWSRGLIDRYNDKLVLLVDGVRVQHLYYGHFSLGDNLPLEKVEKVEIIQGPASSLYGANAFGSIISVTTRSFSSDSQTETTLEAGDNQRFKTALLNNSPKVQVFGNYLRQDAPFSEDRLSFIGEETLQPLEETYRNIFIKAAPTPGLTLSADYQQNDTPFLFIPDTQDGFIEERMLTVSALYETGEVDTGRVEASIYYTRDDTREIELEQETRALGYVENQQSTTSGARLTLFKRLLTEHVFALGASWQNDQADDMSYTRYYHFNDGFLSPPRTGNLLSEPNVDNNDYSVYLQDIWTINSKMTLTLGGRYDDFDAFGGYTNYRGALVYTPKHNQSWKLMYGTAIRTPTFREYLKVMEDTDFSPPTPDPERIRSLELGHYHQWSKGNISITAFRNVFEDYIYEVPTPDDADEYFANSDENWRMYGVESLLRYRLTERLNMRLGVAKLDAKAENNRDLPYVADWNGSLALNYAPWDRHRVGVSLIYNSAREDTNDYSDDEPESFVLTHLHASGQLTRQFSYRFGVNNLFDKTVYDPAADFAGQYNTEKSGREVWLQLQWSPVQ